jgi:hypothetical protein
MSVVDEERKYEQRWTRDALLTMGDRVVGCSTQQYTINARRDADRRIFARREFLYDAPDP